MQVLEMRNPDEKSGFHPFIHPPSTRVTHQACDQSYQGRRNVREATNGVEVEIKWKCRRSFNKDKVSTQTRMG